MSEYIVEVPDEEAELFIARFGINGTTMFGYQLVDEIVRCRDCKYYESIPEDSGDWCGYWTDRIYADARGSGFCKWGERREP